MDKEFKDYINEVIASVIDSIIDQAYDLLIDTLNKTIYLPQPADAIYERTFEFRDKAWVKKTKGLLRDYIGELYFDGMKMSPQNYNINQGYSHGNLEQGIDRRKDMAWILSNDYDNMMNSDWTKAPGAYYAQDYWGQFLDKFEAGLDKLVIKEFKKCGITVEKVG